MPVSWGERGLGLTEFFVPHPQRDMGVAVEPTHLSWPALPLTSPDSGASSGISTGLWPLLLPHPTFPSIPRDGAHAIFEDKTHKSCLTPPEGEGI